MTAKEYCTSHDAIAYYSGLSGLEIHGIEYGVDDSSSPPLMLESPPGAGTVPPPGVVTGVGSVPGSGAGLGEGGSVGAGVGVTTSFAS